MVLIKEATTPTTLHTKAATVVHQEGRCSNDVGGDAFLGRIAVAAAKLGNQKLQKALSSRNKRPSPMQLAEMALETLSDDSLSKQLFVVSGLENLLDHRDNSFYKENTLELTLKLLFRSELKARMVILSEREFSTYNANSNPRTIALTGIAPEDAIAFFEAWRVPEEVRETAQKLFERSCGHPMVLRYLAIRIRDGQEIEALEGGNQGSIQSITDTPKVRKTLRKCFDSLSNDQKDTLQLLSLLRYPLTAQELQEFKFNRKTRLDMLSRGLLEQTPQQSERRYYVHPLTKSLFRRGADFDAMREMGLTLLDMAKVARKKSNFSREIHLIQEANSLLIRARKHKDCWRTSVPFCDPLLPAARELIFPPKRQDNPNNRKRKLDVARNILNGGFYQAPQHAELLLLKQLLQKKEGVKKSELLKNFDKINRIAATPESYHLEASFYIESNSVQQAIGALQKGTKKFPTNGRLHRRLASLMIRQNQLEEAAAVLKESITAQPSMPDNYSLMGDIYTRLGQDHWDKAEEAFGRSKELGLSNVPHLIREANLQRVKALVDLKNKEELLSKAEACLQNVQKLEGTSSDHAIRGLCLFD